ncbi:MAG: DNA-directed RNA polymerase subunit beta' [Candidatus Latescibacteria bacterium]|nr:DNA-directed RNA polymerase subunit beta' [Candidatus Latescibacterota bacterium]NIM21562.1 DNA-directed RNA polymerase subunit beta' [Candidatus Latescibacterota bacterium]NIM65829.1 DNA-directed RNA polymerase subunit beta' [Candidatus Latescibacterota bacterium]NIO02361.1 DNA-directed RNA polymerase subunit beta' [Candidatus Latescibacterota bacterium]NIO29223.1 DNA-directed RNA polymerase subunit beta' [Candidatus Latescibacterota bacterium]
MYTGTLDKDRKKPTDFKSIRIQLASPEKIREWSFGEVTKPETINYRSFKPEKDGLFCERIFGPVRDWECSCGKYKRIRYKGVICDRCGVEVTRANVRRERLGHIELAVPVSHIWFFKGLPSRIGHLLDMTIRDLERVLYYESFIMVDPGDSDYEENQLISEDAYLELVESGKKFKAIMGAEAIKELLKRINLEELSKSLRDRARVESSAQRKKDILKRLKVVEAFRNSNNKPEWMIMDMIPVLPPELRPLVPLEGGRFATSDLNDLYRRVINRNNRLKKLIEIKAPEVILRNEKRMLQEAVDALFDNGRRSRAVRGQGNRPLKSLSDMLKGKQGRFRQNLLGKRVDYSGRSVIVIGPELKIHECGLPKSMALELFKPFIIRKLEEKNFVQTVKSAKKLVEQESPEVWDILEEIIQDHPVLLNRAPTLHRLGIQAFQPVLVEGKAIRIHPLVCAAFNADFDGDQMAVHVPLSYEAQLEARTLMLSAHNILSPANGKPLAIPSQDMVIGIYYMTMRKKGAKGEGKSFYSPEEVIFAHQVGEIGLHAEITLRWKGERIKTTTGRVYFNEILPEELRFINKVLDKKELENLVAEGFNQLGLEATIDLLDKLKETGFAYATRSGLTIGIDDLVVPPEKEGMIQDATKEVQNITRLYEEGILTDGERYNKVIDRWTRTTSGVGEVMFERLRKDRDGFNPIFMMTDSGSRGSREQVRQLAGMRGLMAKPQKKITGQIGEIIEMPIVANFLEGLSVLQYFISTHGARKGLADTALKTADAGYLTRRLVDVAQDVIVTEYDCGTIMGIDISALKEGEEIIQSLSDRITGCVAVDDVFDPVSGDMIVAANTLLTQVLATEIEDRGVEKVKIRSVLTCESKRGVCCLCYGTNLASGRLVEIGEAVGVIAAQSIGEPGTQLTLRTFHIGGIAGRIAEQTQKVSKYEGKVAFRGLRSVKGRSGREIVLTRKSEVLLLDEGDRVRSRFGVPYGAELHVSEGQEIKKGDVIYEWDPYSDVILTDKSGVVRYQDILEDVSVKEKIDEKTGKMQMVIIEDREKKRHPHLHIVDEGGNTVGNFIIPTGAYLLVKDGEEVLAGDQLCKIPKDIGKTTDITGGLPRVAELFEVRKPKEAAAVSEIDGMVEFGPVTRGMRKIIVKNENGDERSYIIPQGKHLRVYQGDHVEAGDQLTEGPINPFDILNIKGVNAAQAYLVNGIQEVYRLQGVVINDKHIETIVRQMLQKVQIEDPGDTMFLEGDLIDKGTFREENERVMAEGKGKAATFKPILLGITKASLSTDSFISAASFQETTRVLTDAAVKGKTDRLLGLKENVIMGHLIPAGTGLKRYDRIELKEDMEDEEEFGIIEEPEEGVEQEPLSAIGKEGGEK